MPALTITSVVREVINGDVNIPADDIIRRARARGVTAKDASIRDVIYNVKSDLRKAAKAQPAKPAPAAARETKAPEPAPVAGEPAAPAAPAPDLRAVLANVALVNGLLDACGGVEGARKVAAAVQACGGVEPFLLHLELISQVRGETA